MFPKVLKQLRIKKKLTQQNMADFLGITRQGYAKYENSDSEPSFEILQKMAAYFDVSTDELLGKTVITKQTNTVTVAGQEKKLVADEEFEAFANDPELERWYKDLPNSEEEDLQSLKQMWEIIKRNKK